MKRLILLLVLLTCAIAQPALAGFLDFEAGSIIVPMDPCWQPNNDAAQKSAFRPTGCDADKNDQGLFQAYGMIYEILRAGANVAWVVRPDKTDANEFDFSIAGIQDPTTNTWTAPVKKVDRSNTDQATWPVFDPPARSIQWTTNANVSMSESFNQHIIDYRGGPFVIHKKFLTSEIWQIINAFSNVKVHYTNVSFTAPIDKVLDTVPPKLAILGGGKVDILRTYLQAAGLLGLETLVFNEVTPKQIIEDTLTTPDANGDKFSLFWAPHWVIDKEINAPITLSNGTTVLDIPQARERVLEKLRYFLEAGNSAFLECASIESMEGSEDMEKPGGGVDDPAVDAQGGWVTDRTKPGPRLYTDGGLMDETKLVFENPTGFLNQCAGWTYVPEGGHVHNFKPHANVNSIYNNNMERFIHDPDTATSQGYDYYTGGRINGSPTQGYATYLGGHQYLECSNTWTPPGGTTPPPPSPSERILNLTIGESLNPTDEVRLSLYYIGETTPINVVMSPDGSVKNAGEDGILLSRLVNLTVSETTGKTTFSGISLNNLSSSDKTVEKVTAQWPSSGGATAPICLNSGNYSTTLKSKSDLNDLDLCANVTPGNDCQPGSPIVLKDYHKKQKWDKTPPKMEITVTEFTNSFNFEIYYDGNSTPAKFTLDLTSEVDLAATSDFKVSRNDLLKLNNELYIEFKEVKYVFNSGVFDHALIKIEKISRIDSNDHTLDKINLNWGCVSSGSSAPTYALTEVGNATTLASGDNGIADTSIALLLGKNDTGAGGTGTAATSPTIDPNNISYCNIDTNNTCGTRFVLNTVLGLQFTVITNTYVTTTPIIDRGIAFQGSYEFPTYRGHMQAINITATDFSAAGSILWDAADEMPPAGTTGNPANISQTPASRYIFTNNGTTKVSFDLNSATQTTDFLPTKLGMASLDAAKVLINTIRGRDKVTSTLLNGEGEPSSRLWSIRSSTPAVIGYSKLAKDTSTARSRDRIVYVGADDGMLHAFHAGDWDSSTKSYSSGSGKEIWAYVPSLLLPALKKQNFVDTTSIPAVSVSGSPSVRDILVKTIDANGNLTGVEYKTVLIGTATIADQNKGLVFALDISDPYTPKVLWETDLSSYNIGNAQGVSIGKIRNGDSVRTRAFLTANYYQKLDANGVVDPTNGSYGVNAMSLNVQTGAVEWTWKQNYTINQVFTPPAIPSLLDIDNNGVVDYMVFGDMDGRLWQLDTHSGHSVLIDNNGVELPVFTVPTEIDPTSGATLRAPIASGISLYNSLAIFGTGGTDSASGTFGLYAVSLGEREADLYWKAEATDTVNAPFLKAGEKIWGTPMIDSSGRIYITVSQGYEQGASSADNSSSTGRIIVMNTAGEILNQVSTKTAVIGSLALTDGGAVATDFTGNLIRLDTPTVSSESQGVQVKVFSWRLR